MKIYFNEAFVETKRETNDLWVKGDNGDMLYAFFEGVDLSEPNIYTRLIIQWANGQATNELPMNKSFDKKSAYVTLPILKAGETKFTIRIYENGVLNHTAIFTRVVKESIDASDDTNISPDEYLGINNAINNNTTNIAKNRQDITDLESGMTNVAKNGRDITVLKNGKVDKTNTPNHVYGTDEAGEQTIIPYRSDLEPLEELEKSIIIRDNYGRAEVNWPETEDEIANKEYVDIQIKNSETRTKHKLDEKADKDYVDSQIAETEDKLANSEAETENKLGYLEEKTEYKLNDKADKTFVNPAFKDVEVAKDTINGTYTFTFTKLDNTTKEVQIDTPEEFIIDYNKPPYLEGNNLIITFVGGSTISIDMSTLVEYNTFESTTTITLTEDSNHKVTATLNDGSVKLSHLNTEVISKINNNTINIAKNKQDIAKNKQDIIDLKSSGGGSGGGYEPDGVTIVLNNSNELEVTNVAIWRYE